METLCKDFGDDSWETFKVFFPVILQILSIVPFSFLIVRCII